MLRISAPAKINLFLEITGKRADGYHTLSTIFQTISLADELQFSPANDLELTCSDPSLPTDERNLALRAARQLRALLKEKRGARMHLRKVVPMGAGLGGGSSDAAGVLRGLPRLWKRGVNEHALRRLARGLGADVPFFLRGGLCAASGIGDRLRPLARRPRQWLVLVYPGFGVATKDAYAKVRLPWTKLQRMKSEPPEGKLFNRFEELIFPDYPALSQLKERLLQEGATGALMSGSGSSVFGMAPSESAGRKILRRLRPQFPRSWLVHTL